MADSCRVYGTVSEAAWRRVGLLALAMQTSPGHIVGTAISEHLARHEQQYAGAIERLNLNQRSMLESENGLIDDSEPKTRMWGYVSEEVFILLKRLGLAYGERNRANPVVGLAVYEFLAQHQQEHDELIGGFHASQQRDWATVVTVAAR